MTVEPGVPFDEKLTRLLEECVRDPCCAGEEEASADHERDLRRVLELVYEGSYARCTEEIEALVPPASEDLRASALRAACRAMVSGRVQPAIAACLELLGRPIEPRGRGRRSVLLHGGPHSAPRAGAPTSQPPPHGVCPSR